MSREQLNLAVRIVLAVTLLATLIFVVAAATPAWQDFGDYPAGIGLPQAVIGPWDTPAVWVTISRPAVVSAPESWKVGEHVCMVVTVQRGDTPAEPVWEDNPPQTRWDLPLSNVLIMDRDDVQGETPDGGHFSITNQIVAAGVNAFMPFQVNWFGLEQLSLYPNETHGGLLCYQFQGVVDGVAYARIPPFHKLSMKVKNTNVIRRPAFYLRYNSRPSGMDYSTTLTLQREDLTLYLLRMANDYPFAVRPRDP